MGAETQLINHPHIGGICELTDASKFWFEIVKVEKIDCLLAVEMVAKANHETNPIKNEVVTFVNEYVSLKNVSFEIKFEITRENVNIVPNISAINVIWALCVVIPRPIIYARPTKEKIMHIAQKITPVLLSFSVNSSFLIFNT